MNTPLHNIVPVKKVITSGVYNSTQQLNSNLEVNNRTKWPNGYKGKPTSSLKKRAAAMTESPPSGIEIEESNNNKMENNTEGNVVTT